MFVLLFVAASSFETATLAPLAQENFAVERHVEIPMRDGVVLRADVLRPRGPDRFPVLTSR